MFTLQSAVRIVSKRSISSSPALMYAQPSVDPIQQLFLDKIREYTTKQKASQTKDGLVDASAEQAKAYNDELERIGRMYSVKGVQEATQFPSLSFKEPSFNVETPQVTVERVKDVEAGAKLEPVFRPEEETIEEVKMMFK